MKNIIGLLAAFLMLANIYPQTAGVLNINRISLPLNNYGGIAGSGNIALYDSSQFLYSSGFAFSGIENNSIFVNAEMYSYRIQDYLPGKFGDSLNPKNVLYSVSASDSAFGSSWQKWKDAVELGAEFYDGNNDGIYNPVDLNGNGQWDPSEDKPALYGDKTYWCVFSDGVKNSNRLFTNMSPKGIEIRQSVFAFNNAGNSGDNVVFVKYNIKNTTNNDWDSCYFSKYADIDLTPFQDNVGTDTLLKSVFGYSKNNGYPSCFITNIQAPIQYIPGRSFVDVNGNGNYDSGTDTPIDTGYDYSGANGIQLFPGACNIKDYSTFYNSGGDPIVGEPSMSSDVRNNQMGKLKTGLYIDPCNFYKGIVAGDVQCSTVNPKFIFSGNPVLNSGWLQKTPESVYQMLNIGPFKLNAHNSNNLLFAYVLGKGDTWQMSLLTARDNTRLIREAYKNNFTNFFTNINSEKSIIKDYYISQNYPNPFNPNTNIKYQLPKNGFVTVKIYDLLGREIAALVNENKSAGSYTVNFDAGRLSSGVYFYRIEAGEYSKTMKMTVLK